MLKWFGRLIFLVILVVVALGAVAYFNLKSQAPPTIEKAAYALQGYYQYGDDKEQKIPTRYYYAEDIELANGNAVLTNFWTYDSKRYTYHEGEKVVSPPFDIVRR